jgi:long-chain fatty acid transport protein
MNSSPADWQVEAPKIWLLLGLTLLVFSSPSATHGEGFRNPYQNPAAMAEGNAFAAQADDASAVYYNPPA